LNFEEYRSYDAIGLARLVATGDVTPGELLETALTRLDQVNGTLNAVITDLRDDARRAADKGLPGGPLCGVPFLIKDIGMMMKGVRTSAGSALFRDAAPASADSALIAAYRAAGLNLFGKTNTPEFGMAAVTEPVAFGVTRNPWNLSRTPGGSSGGTAAAVAAGVVPAGHGNDGGGSIRIPASCCGLFGFKPSRGRVSASPLGDSWGGFAVNHALTRSVRDSALLLDLSCQPVPGDAYPLPPPETSFLKEAARDPGKLRIAYIPGGLMPYTVEPAVASATRDAAKLCESLGHHVEETKIDADFAAVAEKANAIILSNAALMLTLEGERRGRPVAQGEIESIAWLALERGRKTSGMEVMQAFAALYAFGQTMARAFEPYDVLLLSTLGRLPVPVGELSTADIDDKTYDAALYGFIPNTQPFNIWGAPAMSVPLAMSTEGLPIGIQFAARPGNEAVLFRLAGQLEKAAPWAGRRPKEPFV
jgi:Asp-tRNA(Asn)/Glu-tRNA(Gln) amidotransferase A subunit family amidase